MEDKSKSSDFNEFLEWYHHTELKKYPRPSMTVDNIIYTFDENKLQVLLIKRKFHPFKDCYCFPGGFVGQGESVEEAALRELEEETSVELDEKELRQVHLFSHPHRDLRTWTITMAFNSFIYPKQDVVVGDDALDYAWFDVTIKSHQAFLTNEKLNLEFVIDMKCDEEDFYELLDYKYQILKDGGQLDNMMAFDHDLMTRKSLELIIRQANTPNSLFINSELSAGERALIIYILLGLLDSPNYQL